MIKEKCCYIAMNPAKEEKEVKESEEFKLPDGNSIKVRMRKKRAFVVWGGGEIRDQVAQLCAYSALCTNRFDLFQLGPERFRATEILFNPELHGLEYPGMPQIIVDSINRSDLDMRKELFQSIVLSGGTTLTKGEWDCSRFLLSLYTDCLFWQALETECCTISRDWLEMRQRSEFWPLLRESTQRGLEVVFWLVSTLLRRYVDVVEWSVTGVILIMNSLSFFTDVGLGGRLQRRSRYHSQKGKVCFYFLEHHSILITLSSYTFTGLLVKGGAILFAAGTFFLALSTCTCQHWTIHPIQLLETFRLHQSQLKSAFSGLSISPQDVCLLALVVDATLWSLQLRAEKALVATSSKTVSHNEKKEGQRTVELRCNRLSNRLDALTVQQWRYFPLRSNAEFLYPICVGINKIESQVQLSRLMRAHHLRHTLGLLAGSRLGRERSTMSLSTTIGLSFCFFFATHIVFYLFVIFLAVDIIIISHTSA